MSYNEPTGWIQTFSCKKFYIENPRIEDICIEDIAHSLSMICRFNGHCREFYSVGLHSIYVSDMCSDNNKLYGLLHDGSEAFTGDSPRPIKRTKSFSRFREIESSIQSLIYKKFNLSPVEPDEVKEIDTRMLATEARDLMAPLHKDWVQPARPFDFKIKILDQKQVEAEFLKRFYQLIK